MKTILMIHLVLAVAWSNAAELSYPIVDTGQIRCYNISTEILYPKADQNYFGQDAHYHGNQPAYLDNGDGTVTDLITGLMWTRDPGRKKTFDQAVAGAPLCKIGAHTDWRLPTIKELYSLILFSGTDPDPTRADTSAHRPFIDTKAFKFKYGDPQAGERVIDSQFASATLYRSTTMKGDKTVFGVNFADGRIKGYGLRSPRGEKTFYVLYVRGNRAYGKNRFVDNSNGTITDQSTGLMWTKADSGKTMNWRQALKWAKDLDYGGHADWRLPNAKELQSLVDYARCPDVTGLAAIDPLFEVTSMINEAGVKDYAFYWTGTSHCQLKSARAAVYVAFGRSPGWMQDRRSGQYTLLDVHGAGSQRSDPKVGDAARYPRGRGPQGDVIRINNLVRCVRGGVSEPRTEGPALEMKRARRTNTDRDRGTPRRPQGQDRQGPPQGQPGMQPPPGGRSGQQGPSAADFIQRLDRDGDGKVSQQEFDGPAEHFTHLDRNQDGYLSQSEAPTGPPPQQNGRRRR